MRILVTSSRMPFALDMIRKLGKEGHAVVASDTFRNAPGSHSRFAESWRVTASPRYATAQFIEDVRRIVREEAIDVIVPAFEEVFYLAWHVEELGDVKLLAPGFDTLLRLHDKAALLEIARDLGIRTPKTTLARSLAELRKSIADMPRYFARPAYSRGGVHLLTNSGPLADVLTVEECVPTPGNPWLVQEFVTGTDVCTYAIVHRGRVAAHAAYVHPRELEHAGGIVFESIHDQEAFDLVDKIAASVDYHGQVSFDFMRTDGGLVLIECNPRPTAGVLVMTPGHFVEALLDPRPDKAHVAPAGVRYKLSVALIRDMLLHWEEAPEDLEHLLSKAHDVYAERGDIVPALYQFLSYSHVTEYRKRMKAGRNKRTDLMAAYFFDILYDGDALGEERLRRHA